MRRRYLMLILLSTGTVFLYSMYESKPSFFDSYYNRFVGSIHSLWSKLWTTKSNLLDFPAKLERALKNKGITLANYWQNMPANTDFFLTQQRALREQITTQKSIDWEAVTVEGNTILHYLAAYDYSGLLVQTLLEEVYGEKNKDKSGLECLKNRISLPNLPYVRSTPLEIAARSGNANAFIRLMIPPSACAHYQEREDNFPLEYNEYGLFLDRPGRYTFAYLREEIQQLKNKLREILPAEVYNGNTALKAVLKDIMAITLILYQRDVLEIDLPADLVQEEWLEQAMNNLPLDYRNALNLKIRPPIAPLPPVVPVLAPVQPLYDPQEEWLQPVEEEPAPTLPPIGRKGFGPR